MSIFYRKELKEIIQKDSFSDAITMGYAAIHILSSIRPTISHKNRGYMFGCLGFYAFSG